MKNLLIFLVVFLLPPSVCADDTAVQKYKNFTPAQIRKLPKKELSSSVPIMYNMAAQLGLSPNANLIFQASLNILMYPGIGDYEAALKSFQQDMGDKPTGVLTVWQIHNLEKRAELQKLSKVGFPDQFSNYITDDFASASGLVTIIDDRIAFPINHVEIDCEKRSKYCKMDQIVLKLPDAKSWAQNYQIIKFNTTHYEVTRWEKNQIDAVAANSGNNCRTVSLNLNFETKEFFEITRNGAKECKVLGETLPRLVKPRISQIIDGQNVIRKEFSAFQTQNFKLLSTEFQKKLMDALDVERKAQPKQ